MADAQELYQQALKAIDSGNTSKGQELLRQSLALDAYNLDGWIKMAEIMPDDELKYEILEQILQLDPNNDFANSEWDRLNDLAESGGLGGDNAPPLATADISSLMDADNDFDSLTETADKPEAKAQRRKMPSVDMSKVKLPEIAAIGSFQMDDERIPGIPNRELVYVVGGLLFFTLCMCSLSFTIINGARSKVVQSQAQETQRYLGLTQTLDAGGTAIAANFMTQTQIAFDLTSTVDAIISPTPTPIGNVIRATEIPPTPTATATVFTSRVFPAPPDTMRGDILAWGGQNPSSTRFLSLYHVNPRNAELTTLNNEMVAAPSVNAVGSRIVYMRYEAASNSALMDMIAANNPAGAAETINYAFDEITDISSPSIASTGSYVVFIGVSPETGRREVYLWDFINQQLTQLTNDGANYQSAAVAPIGNKIVAVREVSGGVDLLLLDRDNAPQGQPALPIVLTMDRGEVLEGDVDFATDGSRILFSASTNGNSDIMVMDMATNAISPVITSEADEILPHFSPDNRYIVYSANPTGTFNMFILDTIAMQTYQLTESTRDPIYAAGWYD